MTSRQKTRKPSEWQLFVERIGSELKAPGFRSLGTTDALTGGHEWSKPAFDGYECRILVTPEASDKGRMSFSVGLSIESTRQAEVDKFTGADACTGKLSDSISILYVSLNWLMMAWAPVAGTGRQVFSRWKDVDSSNHESLARDVTGFLADHGRRFFDLVSAPDKLADVLQNLSDFPGRGSLPSGPLSSSPLEFAAVLLSDLGREKDALACLQRDMELVNSRVTMGDWNEEVRAITQCKHRCYSAWIRTKES